MKNIVTQITEPEQTIVVVMDEEHRDVGLLVFFHNEDGEPSTAKEPDEVIVLGATNAEALGYALISCGTARPAVTAQRDRLVLLLDDHDEH